MGFYMRGPEHSAQSGQSKYIMPYVFLILLLLSGCTERYRYPCQDPKNWNKIECNNKVCEIEGTCTKQVLGLSSASR
jgi:hypothetical protein